MYFILHGYVAEPPLDKQLTCELIRFIFSLYVQWPQFCVQESWLVGHSCPVPGLVLLYHITTGLPKPCLILFILFYFILTISKQQKFWGNLVM